jgi:hypothetical protein
MIKNNNFAIITLVFLLVSILSLSYLSSVNAVKDFCYDQVGDGRHCFENEKRCDQAQKHDELAESPCYNEDD